MPQDLKCQFAHLLNQKLNIIFWQVECNISVLFSAFIVIVVFQFLLAKQQLNQFSQSYPFTFSSGKARLTKRDRPLSSPETQRGLLGRENSLSDMNLGARISARKFSISVEERGDRNGNGWIIKVCTVRGDYSLRLVPARRSRGQVLSCSSHFCHKI